MIRYFLFLSVILQVSGYGKTGFDKRVSDYYHCRNLAEIRIMDSSYGEALRLYKQAFELKYPNARDLYNAFAVAYLVRDSIAAKNFLNEIFINGQTKEKFEQGRFGELIRNDLLYAWLTSGYDSLITIADRSPKRLLAAQFDTIIARDQSARKEHRLRSQEEIKSLIARDSANVDSTIVLFNRVGFPSYKNVGLFEAITQGYVGAENSVWLLLWHVRNSNHRLNEPVKEAVMRGDYPPEEFSLILDMQADTAIYYSVLPRTADSSGKFVFDELRDTQLINQRRAALYLEPIGEYKRKLNFQKNVDKRFYLVPVWADVLNYAPMDFRKWNKGE